MEATKEDFIRHVNKNTGDRKEIYCEGPYVIELYTNTRSRMLRRETGKEGAAVCIFKKKPSGEGYEHQATKTAETYDTVQNIAVDLIGDKDFRNIHNFIENDR